MKLTELLLLRVRSRILLVNTLEHIFFLINVCDQFGPFEKFHVNIDHFYSG